MAGHRRTRRDYLTDGVQAGVGDADKHAESLFATLGRYGRWAWRHRTYTGPAATALGVGVAGQALHATTGLASAALLAAGGSAAAATWARARLSSERERRLVYGAAPAGGGWLTAAAVAGPTAPAVAWAWIVGTVALVTAWAWHRRTRRQRVTTDPEVPRTRRRQRRKHVQARYVKHWEWVADASGVEGADLADVVATAYGFTASVRLAGGQDFSHLAHAVPAMESHYDLPEGAIQVEREEGRRRRRGTLRVVESDPHATAIECQGAAIADPFDAVPIGLYADGSPKRLAMFSEKGARHGIVAGIQGSGKSSLPNRLLVDYAPLPEVVILLIDLKGGQEFGPWRDAAYAVATTVDEAECMLHGLRLLITDRGHRAEGRTWNITPDDPAVLLICDEAAELPDDVDDDMASITRRGRSLAVASLWLTQYATRDAISTQITANCNVRASFQTTKKGHGNIALAQLAGIVDTSEIPPGREGTCFMETPEEAREAPLRIEWTDDDLIAGTVADNDATALSGRDADVYAQAYEDASPEDSDRQSPTDNPSRTDSSNGQDDPELYPVRTDVPLTHLARPGDAQPQRPKLTTAEAETVIRRAFDEHDVVTPRQLRDLTGYKNSFIHVQLDQLEQEGLIEWVRKGEYRRAAGELVDV